MQVPSSLKADSRYLNMQESNTLKKTPLGMHLFRQKKNFHPHKPIAYITDFQKDSVAVPGYIQHSTPAGA